MPGRGSQIFGRPSLMLIALKKLLQDSGRTKQTTS